MRAGFLDVVFPRRCAGCASGDWPFCAGCAAALSPLLPPWCARCGLPWPEARPTCPGCPPEELDGARAAFLYEGPARRAIHKLKFSGWRGVGEALGRAMAATEPPPADAVTWVPLARRRLAERGYDQAKVLAVAVARELGLPTARPIRRAVATGPQARRSAAERRTAMRGAFAAQRASLPRPGAARRRRAHDRRDGGRVRRRAPRGGREIGVPARRRGAGRRRRARRVDDPCLYSTGHPTGSVVARGSSPVVDASRGRNDPRKATLGR